MLAIHSLHIILGPILFNIIQNSASLFIVLSVIYIFSNPSSWHLCLIWISGYQFLFSFLLCATFSTFQSPFQIPSLPSYCPWDLPWLHPGIFLASLFTHDAVGLPYSLGGFEIFHAFVSNPQPLSWTPNWKNQPCCQHLHLDKEQVNWLSHSEDYN